MADDTLMHGTSDSVASQSAVYEKALTNVRTIRAMLTMTCGEAREDFDAMADDMREDYLMACVALADDCKNLIETLGSSVYQQAAGGQNG